MTIFSSAGNHKKNLFVYLDIKFVLFDISQLFPVVLAYFLSFMRELKEVRGFFIPQSLLLHLNNELKNLKN